MQFARIDALMFFFNVISLELRTLSINYTLQQPATATTSTSRADADADADVPFFALFLYNVKPVHTAEIPVQMAWQAWAVSFPDAFRK